MNVGKIYMKIFQTVRFTLVIATLTACSLVNSGRSITFTVSLPGSWSQTINQYKDETAIICFGKTVDLGWQTAGMNVSKTTITRFDPPNWECATSTPNSQQAPCPIINMHALVIIG